ncbi:hypothetical protein LG634_16870 [Streptomyces bambusae]|uniref:hypothetical protein n=1 Tax=Streptomyces bambusae TaxID=1550616 RepID=UPI001CFCB1FC|nr:hypothetical protein [Streptomyces bambusae]MCB5166506.1 hypothetical protein [Streptomyces bambusae]
MRRRGRRLRRRVRRAPRVAARRAALRATGWGTRLAFAAGCLAVRHVLRGGVRTVVPRKSRWTGRRWL